MPPLAEAIAVGIPVFFSAGNNHALAGGHPDDCDPTTIWLHKCRDDVMVVGTHELDGKPWFYSSRGPGQHFADQGTNRKPDVSAPTPRNGQVVHGTEVVRLADGWGTSGACPQVAGLAALLLAVDGSLTPDQVYRVIRQTAVAVHGRPDCEGAGRIDCAAAVASL